MAMSESNKNLVRRCLESAFNKGDMTVIDQCVANDYVYREPTLGEKRGKQGLKEIFSLYKAAFPDCQLSIDEQIAEGDQVVTRWTARGTHRGPLLGLSPTNKQVTVQGIIISRIRDGKIVEEFETYDTLGMLRQLGVAPGTLGKAA
jgi:steroid delta-isomerase-like uncharacterized protein